MNLFEELLESSYKLLEDMLNDWRGSYRAWKEDTLTPIMPDRAPLYPPDIHHPYSRIALPLDNGLVAKVVAQRGPDFVFIYVTPQFPRQYSLREETNMHTFRTHGFTRDNGFIVPWHKVVGLKINRGRVQVDPDSVGITIAEDISISGQYEVSDIFPSDFYRLANRDSFSRDYVRHMDALARLQARPDIKTTYYRHYDERDHAYAMSRMLLKRVKQNTGEIILGDLDCVLFETVG
jgi:hypothetical protein